MKQTGSYLAQLECKWEIPPSPLTLPRDHVHLWKVRLEQEEPELRLLEQTLAPNEQARAERFHFDRDRRRFIAARGRLRMILGRYAGLDPRALVFMYGLRGKPVFAQVDLEGLKFNLAHSGEMALIGVTLYRDIGVDLEEIHSLYDAPRIAERFFSPRESAALRAFPEAERLEAFFRCWTLKEAYLKATGDGLARAIDSFDVTFARGDSPRLRSAEGKPEELWRWSLVQLAPAPGYVGAVAVEGHGWTMTCWQDYAQQI